MELRRERLEAEFLDPRHGFERVRETVEIRVDPLLRSSCRLLPPASLPPPAATDLEALAEQTRPDCPFCGPRIEDVTPRFPPEVCPDGRFRSGEAVLFPNLVPYAKWGAVSVYSPDRHLLPIGALAPALVADNLACHVAFGRAVRAHDPGSGWLTVNANHLPASGSSIFHPHLQGTANPEPTTVQRRLAELPASGLREYLELERSDGERLIAATGRIEWLASFAPLGPGEIRAVVADAASPADLDEPAVAELAAGISRCLSLYASLGFESFNLAVYGLPPGAHAHGLLVRLVARAAFVPLLRSDVMWSERLHDEAATDLWPERLAELGRRAFHGV